MKTKARKPKVTVTYEVEYFKPGNSNAYDSMEAATLSRARILASSYYIGLRSRIVRVTREVLP